MIDRLNQLIEEYQMISEKMSDPDIVANIKEYSGLAKKHRTIDPIIPKAKLYIKNFEQLKEDEEILQGNDRELKELVKEEIGGLREEIDKLEQELKIFLRPRCMVLVTPDLYQ